MSGETESKQQHFIEFRSHEQNDDFQFDDSDEDEDPDYYYGYYDEDTKRIDVQGTRTNIQGNSEKISNFQPSDKLFKKFTNVINVEKYEGPQNLSSSIANKLSEASRKNDANSHRSKDKQDR
jgi:RIO kinase 1